MKIKLSKEILLKESREYFKDRINFLLNAYKIYDDKKEISLNNLFENSTQSGQDRTKALSPIITNFIYHIIKKYKGLIVKNETNGLDMIYKNHEIEIKCTYANNISKKTGKEYIKKWTGNKASSKSPLLLLIGYTCSNYDINGLFIALTNLRRHKYSKWKSSYNTSSSFSTLGIDIEDSDNVHILVGSRKKMLNNASYQYFCVEKI